MKEFFRACHVCGYLNTSEDGRIERCVCCHKYLAPFYFVDEMKDLSYSDEIVPSFVMWGKYLPLKGLTALWPSQ